MVTIHLNHQKQKSKHANPIPKNLSLKVYISTRTYSTAYCDVSEMAYDYIISAFYFELGSGVG